jgi:hypothetical protein
MPHVPTSTTRDLQNVKSHIKDDDEPWSILQPRKKLEGNASLDAYLDLRFVSCMSK